MPTSLIVYRIGIGVFSPSDPIRSDKYRTIYQKSGWWPFTDRNRFSFRFATLTSSIGHTKQTRLFARRVGCVSEEKCMDAYSTRAYRRHLLKSLYHSICNSNRVKWVPGMSVWALFATHTSTKTLELVESHTARDSYLHSTYR